METTEIRSGKAGRQSLQSSTMTTKPTAPRWYVASCGEAAINRTGCMVEVEFFASPLPYGRACQRVERDHAKGNLDSYTMGEVRE